ncbi:MAG: DUF4433 domain-containing protein [Bacteroidales bacterium]
MPLDISKIWLYRIMHINNLEYLLMHGIYTRTNPLFDCDFINIGDSTLIEQRSDYPVGIDPPGGMLGEYIPFYFGPLSPMLLNIKTGYRGIIKRPQAEIVYICCKLISFLSLDFEWCFTDGHAKSAITKFFNNIDDLDKVDWKMVSERYWNNTEDDFDRMRRKQAEFMVKNYIPVGNIGCIIVYDKDKQEFVQNILDKLQLAVPVKVDQKSKFYF